MRDESGFTIVELLVSMLAAMVVMSGVVMLTVTVIHNQARITNRVDADSRSRPAMTHIAQGLHSACVTSHIVPIRRDTSGNLSNGTSISFISKPGSAPSLTPDLHTVYLSGSTLREKVTPATAGSVVPNWDFSGPGIDKPLLTNVTAPGGMIFRYYRFENGALSANPLPVPLSDANAALTSYVTITFTTSPTSGVSSQDPGSPVTTSSGVDLRLENAGQYPNQDNLPCV
jgi:hypothetical protein